jgi:hypothetical protein
VDGRRRDVEVVSAEDDDDAGDGALANPPEHGLEQHALLR